MLGAALFTAFGALGGEPADFHYPAAERAERAATLRSAPAVSRSGGVRCRQGSTEGAAGARAGGTVVCDGVQWSVGPSLSAARRVVVSTDWDEWGMLGYLSSEDPPAPPIFLRRPVGRLAKMEQPWVNVTDAKLASIAASNADVVCEDAARLTVDGEPSYASIAAQLPAQRDTAGISHSASPLPLSSPGRRHTPAHHPSPPQPPPPPPPPPR